MKEKEDLIEHIQQIMGRLPAGTSELLNILVKPGLIEDTKRFIEAYDFASKCTKYEAPWSCSKEAEARYQNIKYGWLGAGSGVGYSEDWCDNCRKKVIGEAGGGEPVVEQPDCCCEWRSDAAFGFLVRDPHCPLHVDWVPEL